MFENGAAGPCWRRRSMKACPLWATGGLSKDNSLSICDGCRVPMEQRLHLLLVLDGGLPTLIEARHSID